MIYIFFRIAIENHDCPFAHYNSAGDRLRRLTSLTLGSIFSVILNILKHPETPGKNPLPTPVQKSENSNSGGCSSHRKKRSA